MARALGCRVSRRLLAIIEQHEALAAVAGRRRAPSRLLPAREGVLRNRVRARASARLAAGAVGRHLAHSLPLRGHARMSSLSPEAYAVIEGRHSDPFRYLGPHVEGDVPLVRIFLPDADGVAIVDEQGHERGLERIHDAGLFEGRLSNGSRRYRVRARYGERQVEIEDPYRFPPILSDFDLYLLGEGTHTHLYEKLGAHPMVLDEVSGVAFAVFAPNAQRVSVVGDFNSWNGRRHPMRVRGNGFWEIFMPEAKPGSKYKYEIIGADGRMLPLKSDPLAFAAELRPQTASIVVDLHAIPPADSARRPTLPAWWTPAIAPAWPSFSIGCPDTSRTIRTGSVNSTARQFTNMPIRCRAAISSGTRSFIITRVPKSQISSSPMACSGPTAIASTGCASTPSRRCSTSITADRRAAGSGTNMAAAKTSKPSACFGASIRKCSRAFPTRPRRRRNRRPGRWYRSRLTGAGWDSATSGIWDGCTTRSNTSAGIRSTASIITVKSCSACTTRSPKISSCRSPMTRSCTASAPSSAACRATNGSALQICAPITVSCSAIPARSFCSWAESSARKTNGGTTTRSIGISLSGHGMQAFRL